MNIKKILNTLKRSGLIKTKYKVRKRTRRHVSVASKAEYENLKDETLRLVKEKIEKYNNFYNFKINKISIKNQRTRWGSCSRAGNLNFNYRLVLLPVYLAEYVVVHEICHIGQFDHSALFWELVSRTMPDYKKYRAELKLVKMSF